MLALTEEYFFDPRPKILIFPKGWWPSQHGATQKLLRSLLPRSVWAMGCSIGPVDQFRDSSISGEITKPMLDSLEGEYAAFFNGLPDRFEKMLTSSCLHWTLEGHTADEPLQALLPHAYAYGKQVWPLLAIKGCLVWCHQMANSSWHHRGHAPYLELD